jgi:RNA polymerase sigma factor (sigma-70 family)
MLTQQADVQFPAPRAQAHTLASAAPSAITASGDMTQLYRTYATAVTGWARKLVRSLEEAEDITHEVFLVVHRRTQDLPSIANPSAWLHRITLNIVRHRWRDQRKAAVTRARLGAELDESSSSPFDELERRSLLERVATVLDGLPSRQRQLILLGDVRCLPTSSLCAMTGIKHQTLRVHRFRARKLMARRMRELDRPALPGRSCARSQESAKK